MRIVYLLICWLFIAVSAWAEDEEAPQKPVIEYLEMAPKFTVNLDGPRKYLMINVQLMVEGQDHLEKIKKHLPALRHELIMLFSGRKSADLGTMEQRESLRQESIDAVRKTLEKYADSDGFRDLFFTEFLVH
ncbi:MAG: hypothetical protein Kow0065_00260 [Methylomicrobium sp.]